MRLSQTDAENKTEQTGSLPTVNRDMLHEQIYKILCDNLMMGRFSPGQKLTLRGLAKELGTSLMPVRDALQRLESQGCLISTPQRTMMVPTLSTSENEGICHLRRLLEGDAARHAAIHCSHQDLAKLEEYCNDIKEAGATDNLDLFLRANFHFHMLIAEASRIALAVDILRPLWMRIGPMVRAAKPDHGHLEKAIAKHQAILSALKARSPDEAEAAMRADITECQIDVTNGGVRAT